jgi:hypothetical protein
MRGRRLAAAALTVAVLGASAANAAIITVTATGTVKYGYDQSGIFGSANTDLTGSLFSVVATFDTGLGTIYSDPTHEQLYWFWQGSPGATPGATALTINGVTVNEQASIESSLVANGNGYFGASNHEAFWDGSVTTENYVSLNAMLSPAVHLGTSWHSDCPVEDKCSGGFDLSQYNYVTNPGAPSSYIYSISGGLNVASIDVDVSGAVPEPATWAMMIVGFGLAGSALRRRRALVV